MKKWAKGVISLLFALILSACGGSLQLDEPKSLDGKQSIKNMKVNGNKVAYNDALIEMLEFLSTCGGLTDTSSVETDYTEWIYEKYEFEYKRNKEDYYVIVLDFGEEVHVSYGLAKSKCIQSQNRLNAKNNAEEIDAIRNHLQRYEAYKQIGSFKK